MHSRYRTQEMTPSFKARYRDGDTEALFHPSWYGLRALVQTASDTRHYGKRWSLAPL